MKYLFLLLLLLSVPVHADNIYRNQNCRQMYRSIVFDFEAGKVLPRDKILYYGQMCVPANTNNSEHTATINAVLSDELLVAIKAKLAEHELIKL